MLVDPEPSERDAGIAALTLRGEPPGRCPLPTHHLLTLLVTWLFSQISFSPLHAFYRPLKRAQHRDSLGLCARNPDLAELPASCTESVYSVEDRYRRRPRAERMR